MESFAKTDYGKAFSILTRLSCYQCNYKGIQEIADLTLGDCHGMVGDEEYFNANGVSLIYRYTQKGTELLNNLNEFYLKEISYENVVRYNWMIYSSIAKSPLREEFSCDFRNKGLYAACQKLGEEQNHILDGIVGQIITNKQKVAVWGAGKTFDFLYERLQIDKWNIVGVFDKSLLKIGKYYKEWEIQNISEIMKQEEQIDVLVVMVPTEDESKMNQFMQALGWKKPILHMGRFIFYKE